jgi:hypothetical protein
MLGAEEEFSMPMMTRAVPAGRRIVLAAVLLFPALAPAQPLASADGSAPRPHAAKTAPKTNGGLDVIPWFSLAPQGAGLIRTPGTEKGIDLAARQDDTYITVYGRKKTVDLHADREHDFTAPSWSDMVMPREIPIGPPSSCSSGAYRTIGGQPANGQDLVGGLGGGRC